MSPEPISSFFDFSQLPQPIHDRINKMPSLLRYSLKCILKKKKIRSDYFTDQVMNAYFSRFVMPKIRMPKTGTTSLFGESGERTTYKYVYISENYIVTSFVTLIKSEEQSINYDHHYVLGEETDAKRLFVNRLVSFFPKIREQTNIDDFTICLVTDEDIREALGYQYDLAHENELLILSEGFYRVQGDLVLRIDKIDDLQPRLYRALIRGYDLYLVSVIVDRLYGSLLELGYSLRVAANDPDDPQIVLDIPEFTGNKNNYDEVMRQLAIVLRKYFKSVEKHKYGYIVTDEQFGQFTVGLFFDVRLGSFRIYVRIIDGSGELKSRISEELKNSLKTLPRQSFVFAIGDHVIHVKQAYSLNSTFEPTVQPLYINQSALRSRDNIFLVDHESTVVINHREHSTKVVRFNRPYQVEFINTRVHPEFRQELNRIVFSLLRKRTL